MKESTRAMFRKHGLRADRAVHNYIYYVFYYPYVKAFQVILSFVDKYLTWFKLLTPISRAMVNRYHGKVLSVEDTRKILTLNQDISAVSRRNRKMIPFDYAYKVIFEEPETIAVMDCPCKVAWNAPEETIRSCLAVGRQTADFWMDHCGKYNPMKITQEEALDLVTRLRETGHITQAFFKVATGGRTGVICNCHPDTCMSLYGTSVLQKLSKDLSQTAESGYSVKHDPDRCDLCGTCVDTCHFDAIEITDRVRSYDKDKCWGCELCVERCPNNAISLFVDTDKSVPLDLDLVRERYTANEG